MLAGIAFLVLRSDHFAAHSIEFDAPVRVSAEAFPVLEADASVRSARIEWAWARFEIRGFDGGEGFPILFLMLLLTGCLAGICWQLWRLLGSLKGETPFTKANHRRLERLAGLVFAGSLLVPGLPLAMGAFAVRHVQLEHLDVLTQYRMEWRGILFGLALLVIAEVFRAGVALKEEQDLTI